MRHYIIESPHFIVDVTRLYVRSKLLLPLLFHVFVFSLDFAVFVLSISRIKQNDSLILEYIFQKWFSRLIYNGSTKICKSLGRDY